MVGRVSWWSPWWTVIGSFVPVTLLFWASTPPGGYWGPLMFACLSALAVGMAWLTMAVIAVVKLPRPRLRHAVRLWPFLLAPALLTGTVVAAGSGVVPRAVFDAHRSSLEALVAEAAGGGRIEDRRVGMFTVSVSRDRPDGCTLLDVKDAGLISGTGWAHCPDRVPVDAIGDGYKFEPFDGPWHVFVFDW